MSTPTYTRSMSSSIAMSDLPFAPYRLSGTVVGTLLNHGPVLESFGDAAHLPPYKAPPQRPVSYVKPRNTLLANGGTVALPEGESTLEIGLSLGMVMGLPACRVPVADAMRYVAGYLAVADICIPHASVYRPSVRQRAQDGFCPLGPQVTPRDALADPNHLPFCITANGQVVHQGTTGDWVRPAAQLLADVSEFMTLMPGDVLLLGTQAGAPRVGNQTHIEARLGSLAPVTFYIGPHNAGKEAGQ